MFSAKDNDVVDENIIPSVNRFGRDMRDKAGFFKKKRTREWRLLLCGLYGVTLEKGYIIRYLSPDVPGTRGGRV